MTVAECSQVVVPPHPSLPAPSEGVGLAADIVRLLLAKLAEYIVPDATEVYIHVHVHAHPKQDFFFESSYMYMYLGI